MTDDERFEYLCALLGGGPASAFLHRAPPWLQAAVTRLWEDGLAGDDVHAACDRLLRRLYDDCDPTA